MDYKDEQRNEIEALESIYCGELESMYHDKFYHITSEYAQLKDRYNDNLIFDKDYLLQIFQMRASELSFFYSFSDRTVLYVCYSD